MSDSENKMVSTVVRTKKPKKRIPAKASWRNDLRVLSTLTCRGSKRAKLFIVRSFMARRRIAIMATFIAIFILPSTIYWVRPYMIVSSMRSDIASQDPRQDRGGLDGIMARIEWDLVRSSAVSYQVARLESLMNVSGIPAANTFGQREFLARNIGSLVDGAVRPEVVAYALKQAKGRLDNFAIADMGFVSPSSFFFRISPADPSIRGTGLESSDVLIRMDLRGLTWKIVGAEVSSVSLGQASVLGRRLMSGNAPIPRAN